MRFGERCRSTAAHTVPPTKAHPFLTNQTRGVWSSHPCTHYSLLLPAQLHTLSVPYDLPRGLQDESTLGYSLDAWWGILWLSRRLSWAR